VPEAEVAALIQGLVQQAAVVAGEQVERLGEVQQQTVLPIQVAVAADARRAAKEAMADLA
jgi:6,7-dimethyl-8-ribityllumazine synthase